MEGEVSCDDPQFMNMLETCLHMEIERGRGTVSGLENEIKNYKVKVQSQLQSRKELRERTKSAQENIVVLTNSLVRHNKYLNEIEEKLGLMRVNQDNDYKIMKLDCKEYENVYQEYEQIWRSYHERYEKFPLAKIREEARINLKKLLVHKMSEEFKIDQLQKALKSTQLITWLRTRGKIVEVARAIVDHTKHQERLNGLHGKIEDCKKELNVIRIELAATLKKQEEERKNRTLNLLKMPPPKIHFSHMRTIYGRKSRTSFLEGWKRNDENSMDSLSVDTLMLEEMCQTEENIVQAPSPLPSTVSQEDQNPAYDRPIDPSGPFLDQEQQQQQQQEVEHEDAASEVDGNVAFQPIDAVEEEEEEEEVEHRTDQELEYLDQPSNVSKDKQISQHDEDPEEGMIDQPVAKRRRLFLDEGRAVASPVNILAVEVKKSSSLDRLSRPKITKVENVPCSVSPFKKMEKSNARQAVPRRSQLVDQSPKLRKSPPLAKMSSLRKFNKDNPNPSSMFTPHRYDYSDSSVMSFIMGNSMVDLKDDQLSFCEGSARNFCEYSNISPSNDNVEMDATPEGNAMEPSTSGADNFPKFDFSNILKGGSNRKNLF